MSTDLESDVLFNEAWSKFSELIATDGDAADAIFQSLLQDNKVHCGCGHQQIVHEQGERCFYCLACKREVWFTAGTLFAGVSRLRAWMAAVWFKEWGIAVSSLRLSQLLDIAQSTALNINKKVAIALVSQMDEEAQIVAPGHFIDVIFKRSRHTPADEHPRSELPVDAETVLVGNPHRVTDFTNIPLSSTTQQLTVSMAIAAAVAFIRRYFHGVSLKYLQLYLGAFWCHSDRGTWREGAVLRACLKHPPISYADILHYKTSEIRIMLA
ncbi:hypothetical protein BH11CYA1_BH11CYA1_48600 [soil metagenome]